MAPLQLKNPEETPLDQEAPLEKKKIDLEKIIMIVIGICALLLICSPVGLGWHYETIRDDAKLVKRPKCLLEAHAALLVSMDERINAHIAFLGQQDNKVALHLELANTQLEFFVAQLESAKQKAR